ncbi:MAG: DUF2029 domain-containing protein [Lentisphaeria bacterium]|nr:DUF2029 domain-containing protein [Lentisphaeria bacterium]
MTVSRKCRYRAATLLLLAAIAAGGWLLAPRNPFDAGDWLLRWRELRLLQRGIDPFDVFTHRIQVPGCVSLLDPQPGNQAIHNYAPWTYGFCFPAAWLSGEITAARLMLAVNAAGLLLLAGLIWLTIRERTDDPDRAILLTAAALLLDLFPLFRTLSVGNFSIAATTAALALAMLLNRKHDLAAGFMLAILMLKIQIGAVFLIPLLMARKYRTLAVGGGLCAAASCIPAWFTGKMPWTLTWQLLHSGDPSFVSPYTGGLFSVFARVLPASWLLAADAVIALGVLILVSRQLRHHRDWLLKLVPAAAVVPLWNYSQTIDQCLLLLPLVWYLTGIFRAESRQQRNLAIAAAALFSTGFFHAVWHIFVLSGRFLAPDGLGPLFIGLQTICYAGWLILLLRLPQEPPDHS